MRLAPRFEAEEISRRVAEVALDLDRDFRGGSRLLISILKGSSFFLADLARNMADPVSCEFISVRRAEGANVLRIDYSTGFTVKGRHVLLLKDVVHTGVTESYLIEQLRADGMVSVRLAAIVDKPQERKTEISVDFPLFSSEGGIFVGYGMEHRGRYANLPYIAELFDEQ